MKTAFITFIYPNAQKFFQPFIESLNNQTDLDFELLLFNDGCTETHLQFFKNSNFQISIIQNLHPSLVENRMAAFKKLINMEFEYIIFGDIDDTFATNRVEILKEELKYHKVVINDLDLNDTKYNVLKKGLVQEYLQDKCIIDAAMIRTMNLIGFSHLALRKSLLENVITHTISSKVKIIDWIVATNLLQNTNAYFTSETYTNYVFHENNLALSQTKDIQDFMNCLNVKINHYKEFQHLNNWYYNEWIELNKIKEEVRRAPEAFKVKIKQYMRKRPKYYYPWWGQIEESRKLKDEIFI